MLEVTSFPPVGNFMVMQSQAVIFGNPSSELLLALVLCLFVVCLARIS